MTRRNGLGMAIGVTVALSSGACSDKFDCGEHGGSCDPGEVCVLGDGCSTCTPAPASCEDEPTCGCLPAYDDPAFGELRCVDGGACSDEDGVVVTCDAIDWGCG